MLDMSLFLALCLVTGEGKAFPERDSTFSASFFRMQ